MHLTGTSEECFDGSMCAVNGHAVYMPEYVLPASDAHTGNLPEYVQPQVTMQSICLNIYRSLTRP